jgi:hypothetical protein
VRRARWTAAVGALVLVLIFVFGSGVLRTAVGDTLVVVVLVAALASIPLGAARQRLAAIAVVSVGAEALQALSLVGPDAHWFWHLTVGSTFDPADLVAYAVGLAVAAALERWWAPPRPAT